MTRRRTLIIAVILLALACGAVAAFAAPAPGSTLRETRDKIAAAKKKKQTLSDQVAALDGKLTAIEDRIKGIGDRIDAVDAKLGATREKLDLLREQLRLKRIELGKAQKKLDLEQAAFQQRVVLSYKTSDLNYLDVVLAASDFEDLVSRMDVIKSFVAGDNALVGRLDAARDTIAHEKHAIADKEGAVQTAVDELQQRSDELAALRASQAAEQAAALDLRKQKNGTLASVNGDIAELERQENQLVAESNSLGAIAAGSAGTGNGTGNLMWPVSGPVTSGFGWRIHPITHQPTRHTGIDIGVGYGTPIHAADSGTVISATAMGGYGNVIMIDHGRGISTLYAHQSSLAVGSGARVSRGQVIGYVGSTGFSTGPHLHFEVRLNGIPVNPLSYL